MLSYRILITLALLSVGIAKRILGVDLHGTLESANESMEPMSDRFGMVDLSNESMEPMSDHFGMADHVSESIEATNKTRVRLAIDTILLRSCIGDLARRFQKFSEENKLQKIEKTRNALVAPKFHGLGGFEVPGSQSYSILQPKKDEGLQEALANVWKDEDHPTRRGHSPATLSADTIKSFGFSLDGAREMCQHQIEQPAIDELAQCVKNTIKCERYKGTRAPELICSMDSYVKFKGKWTGAKNLVSEQWRRLKANLPDGWLNSTRAKVAVSTERDGKTLHNDTWSSNLDENDKKYKGKYQGIKRILEHIRKNGTEPSDGIRKLVGFALGQQYKLQMLRSVTTSSFQLHGMAGLKKGMKPVSDLIFMEERWLLVARGILEDMFQFSIDAAEELCAMREEGNTPVAIGQKMMEELEKPAVAKGRTCIESRIPTYPYCPEGHGPQFAGAFQGAQSRRVSQTAVAWNFPSALGHNLAFMDPFLGFPVFSVGGAMIVWSAAILSSWVTESMKCACIVNECKWSESEAGCSVMSGDSTNPYKWLPFPGTKCVAAQNRECRLEPCNSQDYKTDYKTDIAGHTKLSGTIGRQNGRRDIHNCLSVDGTISGSIFERTHHFASESETDGTKPDEGMNIASRTELYEHLGLPKSSGL